MTTPSYDLVVVGAGPAGSAAAWAAAERGLTVLMVERRAEVGRPVQCAEFAPRLIGRLVSLPPACVAQRIDGLRTILPGGETHLMAAPGYVLNRALFDKHLAVRAVQAGAEIALGTAAVARSEHGIVVRQGAREWEIGARFIVGADGPGSAVGGWIGQRNTRFIAAAEVELVLPKQAAETEVYFAPAYAGGYAWLFPKGDTANAGAALASEFGGMAEAKAALQAFLAHLQASGRIRRVQVVMQTGGLAPVGGLLPGHDGNILLAGDATGSVHPVTGAGILFALQTGRLAGETAARAVQAGDLGLLAEYPRLRDKAIGPSIARGLAARERMLARWTDDVTALDGVIRRNWVAFAEYAQGSEA
jgi:digeranylgeranylglycerophospholipid reductase